MSIPTVVIGNGSTKVFNGVGYLQGLSKQRITGLQQIFFAGVVSLWLHFDGWTLNCQVFSQSSRALMSSWSNSASFWALIWREKRESSAKRRVSECLVHSGVSLMNTKNRSGPRMVPWRTPETMSASDDFHPFSTTRGFRPLKKKSIQDLKFPRIPYKSSLCRSLAWGTLSNALAKSSSITSTWFSHDSCLEISWMVTINWLSHERFLRNPCWLSHRMLSKKISNDQELIQSDPTSCPINQKGNN